jgi:hypothetical protein
MYQTAVNTNNYQASMAYTNLVIKLGSIATKVKVAGID